MRNIPNILTSLRIFMIPLFLLAYFGLKDPDFSVILFLLAGLTDLLDGYIARKYNFITDFGKLFDPLADKLMQLFVAVSLIIKGFLPLWLVAFMILKESFMIIISIYLYRKNVVVSSKMYGKLGSFFITIVLAILIWKGQYLSPQYVFLFSVVIAMCLLLSGIGYLIGYLKMKKETDAIAKEIV